MDYTGDIAEAVTSLISGNELSEAIRIVRTTSKDKHLWLMHPFMVQARRNNRTDLIDSIIISGALDIRTQLGDDLEEMEEQLRKQSARLRELEEKRKTDPGNYEFAFPDRYANRKSVDTFFGREEPALDNVDVMTDISTPMTTFTRYTTAPTATSRATTSK